MVDSIHKGHRERIKNRFKKNGLASFEDHEVLELLLFYAIPRMDTNSIAHRLIDKFGSLYGVFNADEEELKKVDGIGDNAAFLIKLIPELSRLYSIRKNENPRLINIEKAAEYISGLMHGKPEEELHVFCMDMGYRLIYSDVVATGTVDMVTVSIRKIVEIALKSHAARVIISHNHPSGNPEPSANDEALTIDISNAFSPLGIVLSDHIIVSDDSYYSFYHKKSCMLREDFKNNSEAEFVVAAQIADYKKEK